MQASLIFLFTNIINISKLALITETSYAVEITVITHIAQSSLIHSSTHIIQYPYY